MADSGVETGNDSDNSTTFDSQKGKISFLPPAIPLGQMSDVIGHERQEPQASKRKFKIKCSGLLGPVRTSPYGPLGLTCFTKSNQLRFATATNNGQLVEKLLIAGADPNTTDELGRSPLHIAACKGYKGIIHSLAMHGADPNIRDSLGNTPLHLAACTNHIPAVITLLDAGTDVSINDIHGRNPIQLAQSKLKLIQLRRPGVGPPPETDQLKSEIKMVIQMMLKFLHVQKADSTDIEAVRQRLENIHTREQVESEVQCLLNSLDGLKLSQ